MVSKSVLDRAVVFVILPSDVRLWTGFHSVCARRIRALDSCGWLVCQLLVSLAYHSVYYYQFLL
jgi:hypothetical protein